MADYKKMYITLVDEVDKTIERLKIALDKAENIYIDTGIDKENIIRIKKEDE